MAQQLRCLLNKHENWKPEPSSHAKPRCTPKHAGNPSIDVGRQVDHRDLLAASLAKTEKKKKQNQKAKNMWGSGKTLPQRNEVESNGENSQYPPLGSMYV